MSFYIKPGFKFVSLAAATLLLVGCQTAPVHQVKAADAAASMAAQRNEVITTHRGVSRDQLEGSGAATIIDGATYAAKRRGDLPVHPNSLALTPDGDTLYVTVKALHGEKHPAWRKDAADSVVRLDLR